jgi:colicin import membrane protein
MFASEQDKKFFLISVAAHIGIVLVLILGFDSTSPLAVFENTNKNDVISAVVLGDTEKSKIIHKQPEPIPTPQKIEPAPKPKPEPKAAATPAPVEKDVIPLKKAIDKKKLAQEKALEALKKPNIFGKDLLADIKKQKNNKKNDIQSKFQKMVKEQAEKTLRQQLLNEQIKLQGVMSRQAQGEVNKYKALIVQAIGEKWIIPVQANKHLYTQLLIRVAPGGMVLDVQVTKTSGDPSLDSSARAAVLKASPLPVPSDATAFAAFRQFELKVKPENIMEG